MNLADISIKRPTFITALVSLMVVVGVLSIFRLGVDLFPDVTFPIVTVTVAYPGAGPQEVETQISKLLEEELSSLSGVKMLRSISREGVGLVVVEFALETDVKYAEQQVKDRVNGAKRKLPDSILEPVVRRIDPGDQPIMILSVGADAPPGKLYDIANELVKPQFEQLPQVGLVEILGGRKREIKVNLDQYKLKAREISATQVVSRLKSSGQNVPAGKISRSESETVFRTLGEFNSVKDIGDSIVNYFGNDRPVTLSELGKVEDTLEDEKSYTMVNGEPALFLFVFKQSGANTIAIVDSVKAKLAKLNEKFKNDPSKIKLDVVRDTSKPIRFNVEDVQESILFGIILTVIVVYFFLGNVRSTFITGMALPNSLLGAFILMSIAGFTINVMSLLALSLAVGLLIDDAIVVRENIFRYQEMGVPPIEAASKGTKEVTLAVIATTLTVIAVFGPIGFLKGVVGQFFKQFGLTVCFAMMISLFDALTMAPMLSAYLPAKANHGDEKDQGLIYKLRAPVRAFDRFQTYLEASYGNLLKWTLKNPFKVLIASFWIFIVSLVVAAKFVPKTFLPAQDIGEFAISLELPPGTSLDAMKETAKKVDALIRSQKEVKSSVAIVGNRDGEANLTDFFIELVPRNKRSINTTQAKDMMRKLLKEYAFANPKVKDIDMVSGGQRPFNISISGTDQEEVKRVANEAFEKLKVHKGLLDVETSDKAGKPEVQVILDKARADSLGLSAALVGNEMRVRVQGDTPAVYREEGREYDIRVRFAEDQRDIKSSFNDIYVPNINNSLIRLSGAAKSVATVGPANIQRQDRGRYVNIGADVNPNGPGMGAVVADIHKMFKDDIKLPPGVSYRFVGQAENFAELMTNMVVAMGLGVLFIYLVLASLYESFVTPLTIMLVLPLAICGAFYGLFITGKSLDIFSMIGCVMLLGIATKNSILLVDRIGQLTEGGMAESQAIIEAGKTRLRPILMTSFALISGMLPVAIGFNEASKQRTSMGVGIIGGLVTSTLLTLVVIPAAYTFIERFRKKSLDFTRRIAGVK